MKRRFTTSIAPVATILFCALLLGTAISGRLVPHEPSNFNGPMTFTLFTFSLTIACVLLFTAVGYLAFRFGAGRQKDLDRELLDAFLEHIPDNVFFKDRDSRFVRVSRAMATYCGLADPRQAVGKTDADIFSSEHADQALADERLIMTAGLPIIGKEEKETWPDGHETWVLTTKVPLKNKKAEIVGTMGITHNITERKQAEFRVQYLALHDSLTGLPNRALLEDRLTQAIALAVRNRSRVAVFMVDLDRFRDINDIYGHRLGDRLLQAIAGRLKSSLRESDTIARPSGDEFVIAAAMTESSEQVETLAKKLLDAFELPFDIDGEEILVTGSIGVCQFPSDGETVPRLLQAADAAMFEAKKRGRGKYCHFSQAFTIASRRHHKLEKDLIHACAGDEFILHFQPFIDSQSGQITGHEALLRWRHPKQGLIAPIHFIPLLEDMGLISDVGRWVLRAACRQNVAWQQAGFPHLRMAVNLSSEQLFKGSIADIVQSALRETNLSPERLELELTESRALDDSAATLNVMRGLKRLGVSLSLDDFGTGWSSLSYLRQFPIDRLKIDRSFIRDVGTRSAAEAVVKSILALARNLGIECIAEGVETKQQYDYLKREACAEMQGFLFSHPLASADCTALLRNSKFKGLCDSSEVPANRGREPDYASSTD